MFWNHVLRVMKIFSYNIIRIGSIFELLLISFWKVRYNHFIQVFYFKIQQNVEVILHSVLR